MARRDHDQQLVDLERLLQVVERAQLHRLDGALDGGVRRHHQDLRPLASGVEADELADQVEAGQLRHQVVDDQQVERPLAEQPLRLARAAGRDDLVAASRSARPSALRIFSSSSTSRTEPRSVIGHASADRRRLDAGSSIRSSMRTSVPGSVVRPR